MIDEKELKGNSFASKKEETNLSSPDKKIVTSNVIEKKKSKYNFFAPDAKNVGSYVFGDVIVPEIRRMISNAAKTAVDFILFGISGTKPKNSYGQVSYSNYYTGGNANPSTYGSNPMMNARNNIYTINDFIFNDYGEAETVLINMKNTIAKYGRASVGDFYDFIGKQPNNTDFNYGWVDLSATDIIRVRDGFSIRFPTPQVLK